MFLFNGFRRGGQTFVWFPSLICFMVSVVARNVCAMVAGNVCAMVSVVGFLMVTGCYRTAAASPMETVKKTPGRFRDDLSI